jgi:hypothetical protein
MKSFQKDHRSDTCKIKSLSYAEHVMIEKIKSVLAPFEGLAIKPEQDIGVARDQRREVQRQPLPICQNRFIETTNLGIRNL